VKLVIVVLSNAQADEAVEALLEVGQRVTRLASTGGLLRQGNTTLIIGVEEAEVGTTLETVQRRAPGALAIVLPLERYERF
jgi:uncharacterized protein YaaQ